MGSTIGLIINPAAGLGGSLAYKGSDGLYEKLMALGAVPKSHLRAAECLEALLPLRDELLILTGGGGLGADLCHGMGFRTEVIHRPTSLTTSREDTLCIAKSAAGVDLLLFAGGDGTARDIYEAVGESQPVLGIPAGVKIHSAVFAQNPRKAGALAREYLAAGFKRTKLSEVMDIDEQAFRRGRVSARLFGYLKTPDDRSKLQSKKSGRVLDESGACRQIAFYITDNMEDGVYYVIGSGTTTLAIKQAASSCLSEAEQQETPIKQAASSCLSEAEQQETPIKQAALNEAEQHETAAEDNLNTGGTLLGVDIFRDKKLVARDADEKKILETIDGARAKIIVTPIGGQGHIFGRGNQQLSPDVIKAVGKENIIVVSTVEKIAGLQGAPLLSDCGDAAIDSELMGYVRIVTGYNEFMVYRLES